MAYNYYEEAYAKEDLSKCVLEPKIELTIEEAKILLECAYCVDAYTFAKCKKLFDCLAKRIEQAKNCNNTKYLKREIDQWKKEQAKNNWLKNQFLEIVEQEKERKYNEL